MWIYVNGEIIDEHQATVSILDHGYLYGIGLFETFRTYNGVPFLLREHVERLRSGCRQLGLEYEPDEERLRTYIRTLLTKNHLQDAYFRFNVSAGPEPIGLPGGAYENVTEALFIKRLPPPPEQKKLYTLRLRRNTPEGEERLKSHHFMNNVLARRELQARGERDAEGIMLTAGEHVAEGITSNIFFVRQGKLFTPGLQTGILNGITRQWVLYTCQALGIDTETGEYELSFAKGAREVFMTNSIQEIVPVCQWDDDVYTVKRDGLVAALRERYRQATLDSTHSSKTVGKRD